jgi:hypothetical protein
MRDDLPAGTVTFLFTDAEGSTELVQDSGVFIDPSGAEHLFLHPLTFKGSASPKGQPVVNCAFSVDTTFSDGSRLVANGTLIGFFTS